MLPKTCCASDRLAESQSAYNLPCFSKWCWKPIISSASTMNTCLVKVLIYIVPLCLSCLAKIQQCLSFICINYILPDYHLQDTIPLWAIQKEAAAVPKTFKHIKHLWLGTRLTDNQVKAMATAVYISSQWSKLFDSCLNTNLR